MLRRSMRGHNTDEKKKQKKKKRMAKLNKTIKVPYSGFERFRARSSQSIKIGTHLSIDKLIEIGESDEFIDIDCID